MTLTDLDVAIVGAGAAGLSAGRLLADAGVRVRVFEAKDRPGGRAFTESTSFGLPFDRGCHWLHSASVNPYRSIADELGRAYEQRTSRRSRWLFLSGQRADPAVRDEAMDALDAAFAAAHDAGMEGRDVAVTEIVDTAGRWYPLVDHWMRLLSSLDPHEISVLDLARYADTGENYPVVDGYGALVVSHGAGVPLTLSCPVTAIDTGGMAIRLTTAAGEVTARAVIVTVSTSVLAAGAIRFTPALPAATEAAIAACPLGVAEKVAFLFDRPVADVPETTYIDTFDPETPGRRPINFTINPFGRPMAVGQLGGGHARELERAGEAAMVDFAFGGLVDAFGSSIRDRIVKATTTHWFSDPDIRGAYSCALPGAADRRADLATPVHDRLFLAGEAVSATAFSTAHGAHESGRAAARAALAVIGQGAETAEAAD
ncbi:flavin monoamine oxidase family protein [Methylobrevis albus]|uniref:Tryptophan 2-monooxygenase n=1 Tax=Methylobrevis albus TaxID=2793297 RepID=A0A931HZY2_9HYPH|nr:NAD(P)/FAD-dependent oxidoreductase [Methylobrevis albus]MBH0236716.1 FAD-dependent oxidoreductase [Methylobrevis albus]